MTTIGIVGAGEIGGSVAHALARRGKVRRIVLVDDKAGVAAGKALDIMQAGPVEGFHTTLEGTSDLDRLIGCTVCVIADRATPGAAVEWSGDEAVLAMSRLARQVGQAPLVFAGVHAAPLMRLLVREGGVDRRRVIGSAVEAFAAAVRSMVALEARCSPGEVALAVLGTPPAGFVVPWGEASIGGYAAERVLTHVQLARIEARVAKLWPPGPFALGLAAAITAETIVASSRRTLSVLAVLDGTFGARGTVGTVPALLSTTGIVHERQPTLTGRERVRLDTAIGAP